MRAVLRAGALLVLVVVADQATKGLVDSSISPGERRNVFFLVDLVHVRNTGVAFGFFSGGGAIVIALVAAALALLLGYFATHLGRPLLWLPVGLLLGGALGNLLDRVRLDAVRDFLKLPLWPAFNLADSAITIGVLALLYVLEGPRDRDRDRARS